MTKPTLEPKPTKTVLLKTLLFRPKATWKIGYGLIIPTRTWYGRKLEPKTKLGVHCITTPPYGCVDTGLVYRSYFNVDSILADKPKGTTLRIYYVNLLTDHLESRFHGYPTDPFTYTDGTTTVKFTWKVNA